MASFRNTYQVCENGMCGKVTEEDHVGDCTEKFITNLSKFYGLSKKHKAEWSINENNPINSKIPRLNRALSTPNNGSMHNESALLILPATAGDDDCFRSGDDGLLYDTNDEQDTALETWKVSTEACVDEPAFEDTFSTVLDSRAASDFNKSYQTALALAVQDGVRYTLAPSTPNISLSQVSEENNTLPCAMQLAEQESDLSMILRSWYNEPYPDVQREKSLLLPRPSICNDGCYRSDIADGFAKESYIFDPIYDWSAEELEQQRVNSANTPSSIGIASECIQVYTPSVLSYMYDKEAIAWKIRKVMMRTTVDETAFERIFFTVLESIDQPDFNEGCRKPLTLIIDEAIRKILAPSYPDGSQADVASDAMHMHCRLAAPVGVDFGIEWKRGCSGAYFGHVFDPWTRMPDEVCFMMFTYLSVKERLICQQVCRRWFTLMPFTNLHVPFTSAGQKRRCVASLRRVRLRKTVTISSVCYRFYTHAKRMRRYQWRLSNNIDCSFIAFLRQTGNKTLRKLHFGSTPVSFVSDSFHTMLASFKHLTQLSLNRSPDDTTQSMISFATAFPNLKILECVNWYPECLPPSLLEFSLRGSAQKKPLLADLLRPSSQLKKLTISGEIDISKPILIGSLTHLEVNINLPWAYIINTANFAARQLQKLYMNQTSIDLDCNFEIVKPLYNLQELAICADDSLSCGDFLCRIKATKLKELTINKTLLCETALSLIVSLFPSLVHFIVEGAFLLFASMLRQLYQQGVMWKTLSFPQAEISLDAYLEFVNAPANIQIVKFYKLSCARDYGRLLRAARDCPTRFSELQLVHRWQQSDKKNEAQKDELRKFKIFLVDDIDPIGS